MENRIPDTSRRDLDADSPTTPSPASSAQESQDHSVAGTLSELQQFIATLKDERLKSCNGILEIASADFSVTHHFSDLTAQRERESLVRALKPIENEYLRKAIFIAAVGFNEIEKNPPTLPSSRTCNYDQPILLFRAALETLQTYLDDKQGLDKLNQVAAEAQRRSWTHAWNASVNAAEKLQQACLGNLKVEGQTISIVGSAPHVVFVRDVEGREVCSLNCIHIEQTQLGHDRLKGALVAPKRSGYLSLLPHTNPLQTFIDQQLPTTEYPDRSIVEQAVVQRNLILLPVDPAEKKALYSLGVNPQMKGPFKINILTGESACNDQLQVESNREINGLLNVVLPGRLDPRSQEYFSAVSFTALGEIKTASLQQLGPEMSSSVMVVFKPAIDSKVEYFRKDVLEFKNGRVKPEQFPTSYCDDLVSARTEIIEKRILEESELDALIATVRERKERSDRLAAEMASYSRSRGGGGGFEFMMGGGGGLKGGAFGGMYSGYSGVETGSSFGGAQRRLVADPWTAPKIIVFRVAGVGEGELVNQEELFKDIFLP